MYAVCLCVWPCVYGYVVVFEQYLLCTSVRSGALRVGVGMHALRLFHGRSVWHRCYSMLLGGGGGLPGVGGVGTGWGGYGGAGV